MSERKLFTIDELKMFMAGIGFGIFLTALGVLIYNQGFGDGLTFGAMACKAVEALLRR